MPSLKIVLMRHAKAESGLLVQKTDFERELTKRGIHDIEKAASFLKDQKFTPDYIFCSPSVRTKQTLKELNKKLKLNDKLTDFQTDLYEAEISDIIHIIRMTPAKAHKLLIIGHNPAITSLVGYLSDTFVEHINTSGIALLELVVNDWHLVQPKTAKLLNVFSPKNT